MGTLTPKHVHLFPTVFAVTAGREVGYECANYTLEDR